MATVYAIFLLHIVNTYMLCFASPYLYKCK